MLQVVSSTIMSQESVLILPLSVQEKSAELPAALFLFLSLKEEKEEEDRKRKGKKRRDKSEERRTRRGNVRDEHEKD